MKIAEKEREEAVKNDIFHKIRGRYPDELAGETDLDILTAYAWLQKFRMGSGAQAMCCQPLKSLWEAVHENQFGGTYFMRGSKHMIHNTKLHRSLYTFEVFTKMFDAANCVLGEAKYLIEQRGRHEKYAHNQKNWTEFDLATAQSLPRFRNEKTNGQKRLNSMSLHEYLMSCH